MVKDIGVIVFKTSNQFTIAVEKINKSKRS
jgi:hypothetical protein